MTHLTHDDSISRKALQVYAPKTEPQAPHHAALPPTLAAALRQRIDTVEVERLQRDVGLQVEEDWQTPAGDLVTVRYSVTAGATDGYLTDAVDGRPLRGAAVCRSRHVVARLAWCLACRQPTCGRCPDYVRSCALCSGIFCGRCVATEDGRCAACSDLRKLGVLRRRKVGAGWTADAWQGEGPASITTVTRVEGRWSVKRAEGAENFPVPVDDDRQRLLEGLLGSR
jgi:hypothetical protein